MLSNVVLSPMENASRDVQISIHRCHRNIIRELDHIFPDAGPFIDNILAIPVLQHARCDLVNMGEAVEREKERLLEKVFLQQHPVPFSDFISLCHLRKGFIVNLRVVVAGVTILIRVLVLALSMAIPIDAIVKLKGCSSFSNTGVCKVLVHPAWGSALYPATIFCRAREETAIEVVQIAMEAMR